jgi:hypothetical protein
MKGQLMTLIPSNGIPAQPQQISLGPGDKFVLVMVDPAGKTIQTMAPNLEDPLEAASVLCAALGSVLQKMGEEREKSNIIKLPPGTRIKAI